MARLRRRRAVRPFPPEEAQGEGLLHIDVVLGIKAMPLHRCQWTKCLALPRKDPHPYPLPEGEGALVRYAGTRCLHQPIDFLIGKTSHFAGFAGDTDGHLVCWPFLTAATEVEQLIDVMLKI